MDHVVAHMVKVACHVEDRGSQSLGQEESPGEREWLEKSRGQREPGGITIHRVIMSWT